MALSNQPTYTLFLYTTIISGTLDPTHLGRDHGTSLRTVPLVSTTTELNLQFTSWTLQKSYMHEHLKSVYLRNFQLVADSSERLPIKSSQWLNQGVLAMAHPPGLGLHSQDFCKSTFVGASLSASSSILRPPRKLVCDGVCTLTLPYVLGAGRTWG